MLNTYAGYELNSAYANANSLTVNVIWRQSYTGVSVPGSDLQLVIIPGGGLGTLDSYPKYDVNTFSGWITGGNAILQQRIYKEYNLTGLSIFGYIYQVLSPIPGDPNRSIRYICKSAYHYYASHIQIDWTDLKTKLLAHINPTTQNIIGVSANSIGNPEYNLDTHSAGLIKISTLNNLIGGTLSPITTIGDLGIVMGQEKATASDTAYPIESDIPNLTNSMDSNKNLYNYSNDNGNYTYTVTSGSGISGSWSDSIRTITIPMQFTIYYANKNTDYQDPDNSKVGDRESNQNKNKDISDTTNLGENKSGDAFSSGAGSAGTGLNEVEIFKGNVVIPFDSIYMSVGDYNSFVAGKGGIVTTGHVYPNGSSIFIDKIRLSVEGNSMTVVQNSDFDATPLLTVGEKIYGYIIKTTETDCQFSGYVNSMQRKLTGKGEDIIYECVDLRAYLSQYITPAYYKYRPPSIDGTGSTYTFETILYEILLKAGITNANISLPAFTCPPVEWNFEALDSILEWACKYFGKYVYYTSKNGILTIKATDSGSVVASYRVPTRGEAIGTNKVLSFQPMTDISRSRSKVIVTGDYPIKEESGKLIYDHTLAIESNPVTEKDTGLYYYLDSKGNKIYFLKIVPQKTLIDKLITNPNKSAELIKLIQSPIAAYDETKVYTAPVELSIQQMRTEPGDSFIFTAGERLVDNYAYIEVSGAAGNTQNFGGRPKYIHISYRYATRDDSPFMVSLSTGLAGGTVVIKRPEFKKITSDKYNLDDTQLMNNYLSTIKDFYAPIYGGKLELDDWELTLNLLDKVSITNTLLPVGEAASLAIYEIEYDVVNRKTTLQLSNKAFLELPYFDVIRESSRVRNETLIKMGMLENESLYKRL